MHYYQFNIGDYRRDTQHLTPLEHGIYRLLLDQFYLTEKAIDANALRLLCIRSADEIETANRLLKEFFKADGEGRFIHKRASLEIEKYHSKSSKASDSAKKRWNDANAMRTHSEGNANHKPITNNQEPETNNQKPITIEEPSMSALQAKTDVMARLNGKTAMVEQVMTYLNLQARRNYRTKNPNGTPTAGALVIAQRLKEGYSVEQCKDVIGEKSNQWMGDEKMDQYLNPQTLFRKSNFDKYLAESETQK